MDWNRAMVLARRNAIVKEKLARARVELFWMALNDELNMDQNLDYLGDYIDPVANEYRSNGETEQADYLDTLIKENGFDCPDREEWGVKVAEFFESEADFFSGLILKYDRYLKDRPLIADNKQLTFY